MRFIGILLVIASLPIFIILLNSQPAFRRCAYFALGLLPMTLTALNVDAAFYNLAGWLGYVDAISLGLLDTLAIALIATRPDVLKKLPFVGVYWMYILAVAVATMVATQFIPATFYLFQLIRIFIIFVAVASVVEDEGAVRLICLGIAVGAVYQGGFAIYQRATGVFQVTGSFPHQNTMGFMLHFVTIPFLAMILGGKQPKLIYAAVAAAAIAVALSASRGSIAFVSVGIVILFVLSLVRKSTLRKFTVIGSAVGLILLVSPIAIAGLDKRYEGLERAGSYDERGAFEEAAKMMLSENPLGIGPNQYPLVANMGGYSERAGVAARFESRSANVHNTYLLIGSESGWQGLLTFICFFAFVIYRGLRYAFSERNDPKGDLILGLTVTLIVAAIHNLYEWVFVTYSVQTMFALATGLIAGSIRLAGKQSESGVPTDGQPAAEIASERQASGLILPASGGADHIKPDEVAPMILGQKSSGAINHSDGVRILQPPKSRE